MYPKSPYSVWSPFIPRTCRQPSGWLQPLHLTGGETKKSRLEHDVHVVFIRQVSLARLDAAIRAWFVVQSFQSLLQKPLHPFIDKAAADANRRRNVGDRHPLSEE